MATTAFLQKAYLAYFGRPVDFTGTTAFANSTELQVQNAFSASAESQALYGSTFGAAQINAIYLVLFGRAAEPAGLAYWSNQVQLGLLTPAGAAVGILNGALNADAIAVTNKLDASAKFTIGLDTTAKILGYSGNVAAASARDFLATVTATPVTPAQVDSGVSVAVVAGTANTNAGTTFTLTTGIDNFTGTSGNDTILADNANMSASDVISAGAGIDTLIYTDGSTTGATIPVANTSGVEIFNVRNVNTAAGVTESAVVTFSALANTESITVAGRTLTATGVVTAAEVATAFGGGALVNSGFGTTTLTGFTAAAAAGTTVTFTSTTAAQNVTNITTSATGAATAVAVTTQGQAGATDAVVATSFTGATDFNSTSSTGNVNFTALAAGQKVGISGNGAVINGDVGVGYGATVTAGVINVSGGTTRGTITETGAGITSNTINSTGAANTLTNVVLSGGSNVALTINAATNLTTGNITGFTGTTSTITVAGAAASVNLGTIEATTVKTINASGLTAGGVTATLNGNVLFNFTGGTGNDVVTLASVLVNGGMVDAGAGTADRLIVTDSTFVTTATAPFIKGFEVVQANTGVTVDVSQLAAFNTITGIRVNDSVNGGAVTVNGITAAQAANVAIIAASDAAGVITLGLTGATIGGQIDTVNATLTTTTATGAAQVSNLTGIVLTGVEKLTLTGSNTVAATTGDVTLTTTAATSLDSITLTNAGVNTITIASGQSATNLNVDASASIGNTTINASAYNTSTGATLKGGAGIDVIFGSVRSDNISGGAGNDVISGDGASGAVTAATALTIASVAAGTAAHVAADILTGGAGRDVFAFAPGAGNTVAVTSTITDLDLGGATLALGVDQISFDGATAGAAIIVTLTAGQQTTVTAAATLAAAVDAVLLVAAATNNVAQFTYGTDTYIVINGATANAGFTAAEDMLVKVTGVVGTLDASDFSIV